VPLEQRDTYHDADAVVAKPSNKAKADDLARWLPGCQPGELAASPLNPEIYRAPNEIACWQRG
jgi:hypothetical protein